MRGLTALKKRLGRYLWRCRYRGMMLSDMLRSLKPRIIRRYPTAIQLPITYQCNYDCVMCGMRNLIRRQDFSAQELDRILGDKLFTRIRSVGVNGGEPLMKRDLYQCFEAMIRRLPALREVNMISNGHFTATFASLLPRLKGLCAQNGVKLHLALSVDGIRDMQDVHRGHPQAWEHMENTVELLRKEPDKYCDRLRLICTVTKHNIDRINEVRAWAAEKGLPIDYQIATVNVRIDNGDRESDFSVFGDEHARMMAQEFFYCLFRETKSKRYFAIYSYIRTKKRAAPCPCQYNEWVTLTPNGQLGYCATRSKDLGSALENSAYRIFRQNLPYLKEIKRAYCSQCPHYCYTLNAGGIRSYYRELIHIAKT